MFLKCLRDRQRHEGCVINIAIEPMLISIKKLLEKLMRAALKGILKEVGRKAYSANFKHIRIADSRHKERRIAINVQQWT